MMSGTSPDAIDALALAAALPEAGEGALRRTGLPAAVTDGSLELTAP
ncbi:MAG: hypothetical protein ABGX90_12110 [Brachybacterium sp.]